MAKRAKRPKPPAPLPPIVCVLCGGPIVDGQTVPAVVPISPSDPHPVLSKRVTLRGVVSEAGSRTDLSLHEQLEQRAAMGGQKERDELAGYEERIARIFARALVEQFTREAAAAGMDVVTWLNRPDDEG